MRGKIWKRRKGAREGKREEGRQRNESTGREGGREGVREEKAGRERGAGGKDRALETKSWWTLTERSRKGECDVTVKRCAMRFTHLVTSHSSQRERRRE